MFQSLNLFKSINCPFYSQPNSNLTCERPHCQFKHVNSSSNLPIQPSSTVSSSLTSSSASSSSSSSTSTKLASSTPATNSSSTVNSTSTSNIKNQNATNQQSKTVITSQSSELKNEEQIKNLNQLPSLMENLSKTLETLQSFQNFFNSSNIGDNISALVASGNSNNQDDTANKINSTLASLNNVFKSVSSSQVPLTSNEEPKASQTLTKKNSSSSSLKRQQSAPDYNPTPINELKKIKQSGESTNSLNESDDLNKSNEKVEFGSNSNAKRRKMTDDLNESKIQSIESDNENDLKFDENNSDLDLVEEAFSEDEQEVEEEILRSNNDKSNKKLKVNNVIDTKKLERSSSISNVSTSSASLMSPSSSSSSSTTKTNTNTNLTTKASILETNNKPKQQQQETPQAKCDLVSFSKLSLSQQVLKRYEMLNKTPPTAAAINEAKFKKKLQASGINSPSDLTKKELDVPTLILDPNQSSLKIPLAMRQRYLKVIFENGKTLFQTVQKACEKAAEQEKSIYDRAKNKTIYTNLCANLIKSLRSQQQQQQQQKPTNASSTKSTNLSNKTSLNNTVLNKLNQSKQSQQISTQMTYSHEAMLSGPKANRVSYSINRVKAVDIKDLSVTQLYKMFYAYVLSEKQLEENSFPKWIETNSNETNRLAFIPNFNKNHNSSKNSSDKSNEKTLPSTSTSTSASSNKNNDELQSSPKLSTINSISGILIKKCKRCTRNFSLNSKDMAYLSSNSECLFHWGKLRSMRFNKVVEQKYSCCSGDISSSGCEVGKHVYDGDYDGDGQGTNIPGYVETQTATSKDDLSKKQSSMNIYALDCEMCYTTRGLELTRISIIDVNSKEVYESLVKPDTQIIDYNTRWSGLTEESLKNCNKKLKQVQADLLKIFNKDTILIGHSLDSDFKALKLIHKTVIDTSVVFPHKMGPPYKRALRNLMSEYLQKIIQEDVEGHDSKEDATSCIQLMMWKISEDLKNTKKLAEILNSSSPNESNQKQSSIQSGTSLTSTTTNNSTHFKSNQTNKQLPSSNLQSINKSSSNTLTKTNVATKISSTLAASSSFNLINNSQNTKTNTTKLISLNK